MVGLQIGSYKLISKIGEGGMGEVFVAEHELLKRTAAVKLLRAEIGADEGFVKRFINEAKATSQIGHPGVVRIYDFGQTPEGVTYMIMELLDGESLLQRIRKQHRLPLSVGARIIRQMAEALHAAHQQRVVHRDLKPDNVFLVKDETAEGGERAKILDFGIAKLLDSAAGGLHTKTGSVLGTPRYMSPEQCRGDKNIDHRADLYALGGVFFHLVCGRPPFEMEGLGELMGAHVHTPPPVPSSIVPQIPPMVDAVILRLLAKKPEERFANMLDFIVALEGAMTMSGPLNDSGVVAAPPRAPAAQTATIIEMPNPRTPLPAPRPPVAVKTPLPAPAPRVVDADATVVRQPPPPIVEEPAPSRADTTTLRGATGESSGGAIPQRGGKPRSSLVTMAVAFGFTAVLALAGFFTYSKLRASHAPTTVLLTLDSQPTGAEVYQDGVLLGMTPYVHQMARGTGEATFVVRKAGFSDGKIVVPADHDGNGTASLTPAAPQ
jgi:tRNA A-37 threonylcarbamoyl transferase component Bud32